MFRLFKRRRDKPSVMYGVFQRMGVYVERKQRKAADFLNEKAAGLSRRKLLIGFWIFCTGFGGAAIFIIWQGFMQPARTVKVQPIRVPRHGVLPQEPVLPEPTLPVKEVERIVRFEQYLDSLQQTTRGKKVYDSIALHRPGLLDSLRAIHELYPEQFKTSEYEKKK